MKSEKTPEKHKGPGPVMRIRVKRKDGQWKVVKRVHIPEMIIPFSDDAPPLNRSGQMAGFWFEAVDKDGKILYRKIMPPPQQSVELFNADGTMARVDTKSDKYIMEILIPDISEIESVHLFLEKPGLIPKSARVKKASALEPIAIFHVREIEFA